YLDGFSANVQDIIDNFKFRNQLSTLSKADAIGTLINKFLDPEIDLSPAGIDNHSMGSSRSWYASSTRRTTKRRANTGRRATPFKSLTSCSPTHLTAKVGRKTSMLWAARTGCATRGLR